MNEQSVIAASNQTWKIQLSILGVLVGGILIIVETLTRAEGEQLSFLVHFGSSFLVVSSFAFACAAIRCPRCKSKWIWQGVNARKGSAGWLLRIMTLRCCPVCRWPLDSNESDNKRPDFTDPANPREFVPGQPKPTLSDRARVKTGSSSRASTPQADDESHAAATLGTQAAPGKKFHS